MLRNYIKTAWRNLLNNKFYSFINIAGLTVGLTIGIMILIWVQDELSFDGFHKQADNIYRVELFGGTGASKQIWQTDVAPIGPLAKQELPEVLNQVRITPNGMFSTYKYLDKSFTDEKNAFADPSLFKVFDFSLIKGNAAQPFTDDNSVVLTQKTAERYFGSADPIGKVIVADDQQHFTVSGVINDFPKNSGINYDMIMPMSLHIKLMRDKFNIDLNTNFSFFSYETYLLLKPGTELKSLSTKLYNIHIKRKPDDTDADYLLLPLKKMHLYNADGTNKGIETVNIFIVIALVILLIACINYVNLSTARSMLRSKEISMRKIIGAAKIQLFMQFVVETALLFLLATGLALGLIFILMPVFNQIAGKQMVFDLTDSHIWFTILATITVTLAASSIYPALLLSSFEPLQSLKGKVTAGIGSALFRKVLVVSQFAFSVILIIGTIVITNQLKYIRSKDLGFDKDHVFSFNMRKINRSYDAVKAELLKQPGVLGVTRASGNMVDNGNISGDNWWDGKGAQQTFIVHPMAVDKDLVSFFKIKIMQGSSFTGAASDSTNFILNEAAVKQIGMKNPIGKQFRMWKTTGTIIGVMKDFHFASMREKIAPAVFYYFPNAFGRIYIKTTGRDAAKAISAAQAQFKTYNGEFPFNYSFLDDNFNKLYQSEEREGTLFSYFAAIAIGISCLGLLGLAAYTAQIRRCEIGIRRVLGASIGNVLQLLAIDFMKLVLIAIIIAAPIAWFTMDKWLQGFAYQAGIKWWMFAVAGFAAIAIALLTISIQSIKTAVANPVKTLRSE
jgi:putative ABC transport system permease protein